MGDKNKLVGWHAARSRGPFSGKARFFCKRLQLNSWDEMHSFVKSTDKEMIPVSSAIGAHAQGFVVNDELLLPILKALVLCSLCSHSDALLEMLDVFILCSSRTVCGFYR
jgi:hypothetical protein